VSQRSSQERPGSTPAADLDAERAALGAVLVSEEAADQVLGASGLEAGDFYRDAHRAIFGCASALHKAGDPVDEISVVAALKRRGEIEAAGGRAYISDLAATVPAPSHGEHYANIVRDHARARTKIEIGRELTNGLAPAEAIERLLKIEQRASSGQVERPFALPIEDFIAEKTDAPAPLIGIPGDCILPAYGLLLLVAKGGKGKTTSTLDATLHFASGLPWFGFEIPRPLRILFIENEGPREPFRLKLESRLGLWPHPLTGGIYVYDDDWGQASLDGVAFVEKLNRYVAENEIDLIVGDPLDSLGMEGVGSPEDTRTMVDRFKAAGLFSRVAWWVPTHARKEKVEDAIDEASGAWGQRPDALLGLEKLPSNRARLSFNKLRWGRGDDFAYLLGYDPATEAFEFLQEEAGEDRDYAADIEKLLEDGKWRTATEISDAKKGGIGASRDLIEKALKAGEPERFVSRTGDDAKALGRRPEATIWKLASGEKQANQAGGSEGGVGTKLAACPPQRGKQASTQAPGGQPCLALSPDQATPGPGCAGHPDDAAQLDLDEPPADNGHREPGPLELEALDRFGGD
jgi:hypothetical protein